MNLYFELESLLQGGALHMATVLSGAAAGEKTIWRDGEPQPEIPGRVPQPEIPGMTPEDGRREQSEDPVAAGSAQIFAERIVPEPELVICGGGHISVELAALADYMEYPYTVLDDREEFCNPSRFPHARACVCGAFEKTLDALPAAGNAYYIIVTRGHEADLECLARILKKPYGYVGMIGSRTKVARTMEALAAQGFSQEELARVHTPIGIRLGGQTPKEIAVSIVAELIQVKNQEAAASYFDRSLLEALSTCRQDGTPAVMVTVTDKRGSAPRGSGSRMLVGAQGIIAGTIGGGVVEYKAAEEAMRWLQESGGPDARITCGTGGSNTHLPRGTGGQRLLVRTYEVNTGSAAALGMWCGGAVDVMLERLGQED